MPDRPYALSYADLCTLLDLGYSYTDIEKTMSGEMPAIIDFEVSLPPGLLL